MKAEILFVLFYIPSTSRTVTGRALREYTWDARFNLQNTCDSFSAEFVVISVSWGGFEEFC